MFYAAGLQAGGYSLAEPKKETTENDSAMSAEQEISPYLTGKDQVKEPELPYGAGPQAGLGPQRSEKKEELGSQPEKEAPKRTAQEVLDELKTLERSYDDMLQEAEAWESQAALQETQEEMSRWEKKGRELRRKAAELEPRLDELQKEWKYAMDWEWEEEKRKDGYRDPTLWDLTGGSFWQGYDTSALGRESFRDMWGNEDTRKEEYEEKLAGEEYKFMPEGLWEKGISKISSWIGGEAYKAQSPEPWVSMAGAAVAGQLGPQAALPEEVVTVPAAAIMGYKAGSIATNVEIQAGLAYNRMRENGVSEETARGIAMIIGGVNGAIDMIPMDSLMESVKILDISGVPKETIELFVNELEKVGVDISAIPETIFKTAAQEKVSDLGVGMGTKLEGEEQTLAPTRAENMDMLKEKENLWISDHTARELLENQSMLDYLARWGDLKLTKSMKLEERIAAVKEATAAVIRKQKKAPFDREGKKRFKR